MTADALKSAGAYVSDLMTPTLRLGVTGLARSGKTVFITALVRSLVAGGRLPYFAAMAEGRIARAYLEPQPDDTLPRFAYEEHLAELAADPPQWPESTRRISQLRVTIEYSPHAAAAAHAAARAAAHRHRRLSGRMAARPAAARARLRRLVGARAGRGAVAASGGRRARAGWRSCRRSMPTAPADEQKALTGAELFTRYLQSARAPDAAADGAGTGPLPAAGRPRRLAAADLLPAAAVRRLAALPRGTLGAMLARRFESYKSHVVQPFFRDHFARLDRQIVLIDALSADQRRARPRCSTCSAPWKACCAASVPAPTRWLSTPGRAAHRPPAVRRHQGRPPAPHQPRPAGGDPAPARRPGHRARLVRRRRGEGDGARRAQGHARGRGALGLAAAALHRRRAAAGRAARTQGRSTAARRPPCFPATCRRIRRAC